LLNTLNLKLQGKDSNVIAHSGCINGFVAKLALWRKRIGEGAIDAFHNLSVAISDVELHNDLRCVIAEHLCCVEEEFKKYFPDLSGVDPWIKLIRNPFLRRVADVPTEVQEEFLELSNDHAAKDSFDSMELGSFWLQMRQMYPPLSKQALRLLIPFSTTYLCEAGFSSAVVIKAKARNKLGLEDDLRCALSTINPRIEMLNKRKSLQKSH